MKKDRKIAKKRKECYDCVWRNSSRTWFEGSSSFGDKAKKVHQRKDFMVDKHKHNSNIFYNEMHKENNFTFDVQLLHLKQCTFSEQTHRLHSSQYL